MISEEVQHSFEEDRNVLNAVQKCMYHKSSPHIDLTIDSGQLRFTRNLQAMVKEEYEVDQQLAE